jgi:hypothetical protein
MVKPRQTLQQLDPFDYQKGPDKKGPFCFLFLP